MTLPEQIILPTRLDYEKQEDVGRYLQELIFSLQNMYESIAQNVNGFVRNNGESDQSKWIPTISGTTVTGTSTYTTQAGWSIRKGIFTELFFDIAWSSTSSTGNLFVNLPYLVTISDGMPFVGVIQSSSISFGGGNSYLVINAIPNTYRGEIWTVGSGAATANLAVPSSGQLIGNLRFIGVSEE